jgi:TIR domain
MSLYTSSYLKQLATSRPSFITDRQRLLTESVKESKIFDIFLSHSFLDREEVSGIFIELSDQGYDVYVDWIVDPQLDRKNVTKESAELVRKRMRSSKSLLLAMSTNAEMSKWIPWELGFMDGHTKRCALFPVSKEYNPPKTFKQSEYLHLYPYMKKAAVVSTYTEDTYITESANRYVTLSNWVRRSSSPEYNYKNIDIL